MIKLAYDFKSAKTLSLELDFLEKRPAAQFLTQRMACEAEELDDIQEQLP
jgi:hypothetical protein